MTSSTSSATSDGPEPRGKSAEKRRLPGLDGLRAVAIGFVLVGHLAGTRNMPLQKSHDLDVLAEFGVRVFFVISGFLITTLLLGENARTGTVSLRDFYTRRAYRIFPAFYSYLAVVLLLVLVGRVALMKGDLLAACTYTMNFHRPRTWYFGHLWSLSVEEQFYIAWPAIFLTLRPRRAMAVAALAIVIAPVARVGVFLLMPDHRAGIGETLPTVFDALATGCLLAGLRDWMTTSRSYTSFSRSPFFLMVPLVAFAAVFAPRVWFQLGVGPTIENVGVGLTVDWLVRCQPTRVALAFGRILNGSAIVWMGRISYSLYLWQQLFLNRTGGSWVHSFPVNLTGAFGAATVSYYLIEQPFLRLRERRAHRKRSAGGGVRGLAG